MSAPPAKIELPTEEKAILDALSSKMGDKTKIVFSKPNRIKISIAPENQLEVAKFVRDELHFDQCANVTGTDFPKDKQIEVTYHFGSIDGPGLRRVILSMAMRVASSSPEVSSLIELYPSADLHEREQAEMLGIVFKGHPNLSRLLLPEDWTDIPPMLKAYRLPGRLESE
jgi:NADH:ubiquinone oxidoreductase subunit C